MCIWSVDFLNAFLTWHSEGFHYLIGTCDGCISELCNRFDGVCDIKDQWKAGCHGVKCDKGTCIILYKYSWKVGTVY
jgi:hypothetical protein